MLPCWHIVRKKTFWISAWLEAKWLMQYLWWWNWHAEKGLTESNLSIMEVICDIELYPKWPWGCIICSVKLGAEVTIEINLYEISASCHWHILGTDGINGNFKSCKVLIWKMGGKFISSYTFLFWTRKFFLHRFIFKGQHVWYSHGRILLLLFILTSLAGNIKRVSCTYKFVWSGEHTVCIIVWDIYMYWLFYEYPLNRILC